jgi:hypothetical protein
VLTHCDPSLRDLSATPGNPDGWEVDTNMLGLWRRRATSG